MESANGTTGTTGKPARQKRDDWFAVRLTPADKQEIKARARAHGLTMSRYVINAALDRLDPAGIALDQARQEFERRDAVDIARRLDQIEQSIARIERITELGALG